LTTTMQLAFLGTEFEIDLGSVVKTASEGLSAWQYFDLILFVILYLLFILLSIILLLNLLIAMLSFSFDGVREASTLKCRLAFAQYVLRLEMYAEHIGIDAKVGTITPDGRRTFEFRAVEGGGKVVEDGVVVAAALDGGQEDPFRDTQPYSLQELEGHIGLLTHANSLMDTKLTNLTKMLVSLGATEEATEEVEDGRPKLNTMASGLGEPSMFDTTSQKKGSGTDAERTLFEGSPKPTKKGEVKAIDVSIIKRSSI